MNNLFERSKFFPPTINKYVRTRRTFSARAPKRGCRVESGAQRSARWTVGFNNDSTQKQSAHTSLLFCVSCTLLSVVITDIKNPTCKEHISTRVQRPDVQEPERNTMPSVDIWVSFKPHCWTTWQHFILWNILFANLEDHRRDYQVIPRVTRMRGTRLYGNPPVYLESTATNDAFERSQVLDNNHTIKLVLSI